MQNRNSFITLADRKYNYRVKDLGGCYTSYEAMAKKLGTTNWVAGNPKFDENKWKVLRFGNHLGGGNSIIFLMENINGIQILMSGDCIEENKNV